MSVTTAVRELPQPIEISSFVPTGQSLALCAKFAVDPLGTMRRIHNNYGPAACLRLPDGRQLLHVVGAEAAAQVIGRPDVFLSGGATVSGPQGSAHRRLRHGIIRANGKEHEYYRALISPDFKKRVIDEAKYKLAEIVVSEIERIGLDRPFDIREFATNAVKQMSGYLLFGECTRDELIRVGNMAEEHVLMGFNPGALALQFDIPGLPYRRLLSRADSLEQILLAWAEKRRGQTAPSDLLGLLVNSPDENGNPVSDAKLVGHAYNLFVAAYETTAASLTWFLFCLAQSPGTVERIMKDIDVKQPDGVDQIFASYAVDQTIWEALRVLTPVPYQRRRAASSAEAMGLQVTRGDIIIFSGFETNRAERYYRDPDHFHPERWGSKKPSPAAWPVFSNGPRHCIGFWMGLSMLKAALHGILASGGLRLVDGQRLDATVALTLRSRQPIRAVMLSRDPARRSAKLSGSLARLVRFDE